MCPEGVPLRIAIPAAGVQIVLYGIPKKCTNCMLCWMYCPDSSIEVKDGQMTGIDLFHCKGCGVCVQECKFGALELIPETEAQEKGRGVSNG